MKRSRQGNLYAQRVREFASHLAPNSVAIIVSNPESTRSNDTEYEYRQSSDMLYLNAFPEPESALVVTNCGGRLKLIMFVLPKDPIVETWTGIRVGVDGARKHYLAGQAFTVDKFADVVGKLIEHADCVSYKFGRNKQFDVKFRAVWEAGQLCLHNPETIIHEMRLVKSAHELGLIQKAADISAQAHVMAMKRCRPGLAEYQLKATLEQVFTDRGAAAPSYSSIIASGNNACVLHYTSNRSTIQDGQLVLIDAACEYGDYAADVTRTFPANGKFTRQQRQIYELVLKAQETAIAAIRPGVTQAKIHSIVCRVLRCGLVKLGILSPEMGNAKKSAKIIRHAAKAGTEQDLVSLSRYYMHYTGHMMGIDVHDVGNEIHTDSYKHRKLEPGMVFTVEPGLYFNLNDMCVPRKYRGIGIRIEDDVVVTEDGCRVLTSAVPKSVEEIESLMA